MEKEKLSQLENAQKKLSRLQLESIFKSMKKLPVYFWVMFILLTATMLNTLRLHYVMQDMVLAENQKTEMNRSLALKYHENRSEREAGLRDHIEKLNSDVETIEKQKRFLASELKKSQDLCFEHSITIAKAKAQDLADKMFNEAYQTIAMNAVPLNLQQYLSVASDEQWIGYAQMAAERNAYNVVKTIASIPALMKIEKVASIVNDYSEAMELAKNNK